MRLLNIMNFGVHRDMDVETLWRIRALNVSNVIVLLLLILTLLYRILFLKQPLSDPIIISFFPFIFTSLSIIAANYFNQLKAGYFFIIYGNWFSVLFMVSQFGYFYQISMIMTMIIIGGIFLFYSKKHQLFILAMCLGSVAVINLTIQGEGYGLDRVIYNSHKIPILNTINDLVYMLIISGIVAYGKYFTLYYKKTMEARNLSLEESKNLIEKQAADLQKVDKLKNRFFANISHELRTPITMMIGPIKKVLNSNDLTVKNYELLNHTHQNSLHLLDLVDEILDLSKAENHKVQLKKAEHDVGLLIEDLTKKFQMLADTENKKFTTDLQIPEATHSFFDAKKLKIVLKNLLINAFKFTKESGHISLKVFWKNDVLQAKVEDNGRGVHPNDLPNIFKRFYQSNEPDVKAEGGAGIGLSLCRQYVELMEGSIEVESEWGKGSIFTVKLPMVAIAQLPPNDAPFEKVNADSPHPILTPSSKPRLLIVEDNLSICAFLESILHPHYDYEIVHNGKKAINFLAQNSLAIDLIISDIMMPEMDGFQLLDYLKSSAAYRHIPTIMLTARIGVKDRLRALRSGVDDYLTKPFLEEELLVRVNNLIANYQTRIKFISSLQPANRQGATATLPNLNISQEDQNWVEQLETAVKESLENFDLTVEMIADKMCISRPQLFRRMKALIGITPMDYIQQLRFEKARQLLEERKYSTVKAVSYSVGFKSERNFARNFKKRFGRYPSDYL